MKIFTTNVENTLKEFTRVRRLYAKVCESALEKHNFAPSEINIMIFLSSNPEINIGKDLVYYLGVSKSLIARSVDNLVKQGLLLTKEDEHDKRIQHLLLSEKSNEIIEIFKSKRKDLESMLLKGVSKEELELLEVVTSKINQNVNMIIEGEVML